jgi:ABC-type microcin C transport system permease subunit YejB
VDQKVERTDCGHKTVTAAQDETFNSLMPELNTSAQRCLPRFLMGILIFKVLTARRFYKSFGVKGLKTQTMETGNTTTLPVPEHGVV